MAVDTTGTDQGNNAPIGADPVQSPSVSQDNAPKPIELSDDTLIFDKATGKSVKYGEYNRGFQSQFTRARQEAARIKQELDQERANRQRYEQQAQQQRPQQAPGQQLFDRIKELPYLSGEAAAEMVQSIGSEMAKRDQALTIIAQELMKAKQILGGLHGASVNQSFDSKIHNWVSEAGYDPKSPGMVDIAKEIYLAYEGADLDNEFPRIFSERLKQLEAIYENKRQASIQAARRGPFLPGKGGQAHPSKPLEIPGNANPRQIADQLWGAWGNNET